MVLEENGTKVSKKTFGGCTQSACLGPLLLLLIADTAIKKNWEKNVEYKFLQMILF